MVEELECHLSCTLITVTLEPNGNSSCSFKFNHCLKRVILQGADLLQPAFTELPSFTFTVIQRMGNHQVSDVIRYRVCKCVCVCAYCWPINLVPNQNLPPVKYLTISPHSKDNDTRLRLLSFTSHLVDIK